MRQKRRIPAGVLGVIGSLAVGIILFSFLGRNKDDEITIYRNGYGEGSKEVEVYLEDDETIRFTVEEQEYGAEELEKAFAEGFSWARKNMLLENESADCIIGPLKLMAEIPGGISAQWLSSNEEILGSDGTVHNEGWDETREEVVMITLSLTCQGETREEQIYLHIKAPVLTEEEKVLQKILSFIEKKEAGTRKDNSFTLPSSIEGVRVRQEAPVNPMGFLLIAVAVLFLILYGKQNQKKEEQKKRQKELLMDYPVFVHKFLLYLGAGMSVKMAFETMLEKYLLDREERGRGKRVVYEELYVTMNEIGAGIGEKRAYESFGDRLNENQYTRFIALLIQNMEKGNEGLLRTLAGEEEKAFSTRLDRAKKAGEEAGTKLLFPMLLLLVVVMVIIMAPAVIQFQSY